MATINAGALTLLDRAKRSDANGNITQVVELLTQLNPFLEDMVWKESNLATGELVTHRTALPSVTYRRFNEGIQTGKSRTAQFTESCALITARSTLDVDLAEVNGNTMEFRASEESGFIQAMSNEAENGMIYNSTSAAPEKWHGLAPRFASTTQAMGGSQIVLADASPSGADQTSIWLVGWGEDSVYGIYPKGSKAGLETFDGGKQLISDGSNDYWAYVTDWKWRLGMVVKDYRYVARVANIDTSAISATGDNIVPAMIRAYHKIYSTRGVRMAWYCNRTIATYLHLQALEKTKNATLTIENIGGKPITHVLGIPVRSTDAILNTEAVIS